MSEKEDGNGSFFVSRSDLKKLNPSHRRGKLRNEDASCLLTFGIKGVKELDSTNLAERKIAFEVRGLCRLEIHA